MRQTGIASVGQAPWGTHLCQFYRTRQDLLDILLPYLEAGLEGNECCIWVTGDLISVPDAERALQAAMPDLDRRRGLGQIEILDSRDWYLAGSVFDAGRVLDAWLLKLKVALARGYAGLRVAGNMSWVDEGNWDRLVEYEAAANSLISQSPIIALCSYPMLRTAAFDLSKFHRTHPVALVPHAEGWAVV